MKFMHILLIGALIAGGCRHNPQPGSDTLDAQSGASSTDWNITFMKGNKQYQEKARAQVSKLTEEQRQKIREALTATRGQLLTSYRNDPAAFRATLIDMSRTIYYTKLWQEYLTSVSTQNPDRALANGVVAQYLIKYNLMRDIVQDNQALVRDVYTAAFDRANGGPPVPHDQFLDPSSVVADAIGVSIMFIGATVVHVFFNDIFFPENNTPTLLWTSIALVGSIPVAIVGTVIYEVMNLPESEQ